MAIKTKQRDRPLQQLVDDFNRRFPVGTPVYLRMDFSEVLTTVRAPAQVMAGMNTAIGWFKGIAGSYSIEQDRVRRASAEGI